MHSARMRLRSGSDVSFSSSLILEGNSQKSDVNSRTRMGVNSACPATKALSRDAYKSISNSSPNTDITGCFFHGGGVESFAGKKILGRAVCVIGALWSRPFERVIGALWRVISVPLSPLTITPIPPHGVLSCKQF